MGAVRAFIFKRIWALGSYGSRENALKSLNLDQNNDIFVNFGPKRDKIVTFCLKFDQFSRNFDKIVENKTISREIGVN